MQTIEELREEFFHQAVLKATLGQRIIASVRGYQEGDTCFVERDLGPPEQARRAL